MIHRKYERLRRDVDAREDVLGEPDVLAAIGDAMQERVDAQEAGRIPAEPL